MNLFKYNINNKNWDKVYTNIEAFSDLIKLIFEKEKLPFSNIELLIPGTNANFRVGEYVIKIFAPLEAGMGIGCSFDVEVFGIKLALKLDIPTTFIISYGTINDRYEFKYIITKFINAKSFGEIEKSLSYQEKIIIGKKLRVITDKLNQSIEGFSGVDVISNALNNDGWLEYPKSFQKELFNYLNSVTIQNKVYCHGDLNPDNILVDKNFNLYIIDFADSMYAPIEYEHALVASELFSFEKPFMLGYFGDYSISYILDLCMKILPMHDSGEHTIKANLKDVSEIVSFDCLREKLRKLITYKYYK